MVDPEETDGSHRFSEGWHKNGIGWCEGLGEGVVRRKAYSLTALQLCAAGTGLGWRLG